MNKSVLLASLCVAFTSVCAAQTSTELDESQQQEAAAIPPTPQTYMGREIAITMHYTGAPWLVRESREREEGTKLLLDQLDIEPGMTICDMGCGNGFYTIPMAEQTGKTGRVYAVDIQQEMLDLLQDVAEEAELSNIEGVLGTVINPKLPEASIDLMLVVDVYHEMSHPEQMLAAIRKSLKPDGRIVLVEFRAEDPKVPIKKLHKMSKVQVLKELIANGFKLKSEFNELPRQHMLTFQIDPDWILVKPAARESPGRPNVIVLIKDDQRYGDLAAHGNTIISTPNLDQLARGYSIPLIDLASQVDRQVVVDKEEGQYLGHPTTVLLEDGKTIIAVYPKGHGRGAIVMKRSTDGGLTWSDRLPVPESWATSKETPTIHRVIDPRSGTKRLILFSGLYPIRMSVSEDDGFVWSELEPIGDFGGIVTMATVERLKNGDYIALFHDDGRFLRGSNKRTKFQVFKTLSKDGGLIWDEPMAIAEHATAHLCEPGLIRSPDGKQIAVLLRENSRTMNSFVMFSEDEGETWSKPRELPGALTGDRHTGKYAPQPDGRLFISFRDTTHESATKGDWVGWVGTYDDILHGREGQYRVRLMDNRKGVDCAYPAVEVLPDGMFITTTYGHWIEGEAPFIVSVRFRMEELDASAASEVTKGKNNEAQSEPH